METNKKIRLVLILVGVIALVMWATKKPAQEEQVDETAAAPQINPPNVDSSSPPPPVAGVVAGTALTVFTVRLQVRDGHPERYLVCAEVALLKNGGTLRPVSGFVASTHVAFNTNWNHVSDNNPNTYYHSDGVNPTNLIQLNYDPAGVLADQIRITTRPDSQSSATDRMTNIDVLVIGNQGNVVWKVALSEANYNANARTYTFDLTRPAP